jgi:hypothetical protein
LIISPSFYNWGGFFFSFSVIFRIADMKKLFLYIFLGLILCNTGFARTTGCTDGDCENGVGTWTYTDKTTYVGKWDNGLKHGQGTVTWPNGYIYVGEFQESKWHGQGTLTFPDGAAYVGEWRDGFMNGQGSLTLADGKVKKGIWKDGALVEPN